MTAQEHAYTWRIKLQNATTRRVVMDTDDLVQLMGDCEGQPDKLVEARAQKAALLHMRAMLVETPALNKDFKAKTGIGWLDKLLTMTRLKELKAAKVVMAGRSGGLRYDITELAASWYGRKMLDGMGHNKRRRSLDRDEYAAVEAECKRIGLTLPKTVEPTVTERFFSQETAP